MLFFVPGHDQWFSGRHKTTVNLISLMRTILRSSSVFPEESVVCWYLIEESCIQSVRAILCFSSFLLFPPPDLRQILIDPGGEFIQVQFLGLSYFPSTSIIRVRGTVTVIYWVLLWLSWHNEPTFWISGSSPSWERLSWAELERERRGDTSGPQWWGLRVHGGTNVPGGFGRFIRHSGSTKSWCSLLKATCSFLSSACTVRRLARCLERNRKSGRRSSRASYR